MRDKCNLEIYWRHMVCSDIADIACLADNVHPNFPESDVVLFEKLELFPSGCFSLIHHDHLTGYILSHPWKRNCVPPLDELLCRLPKNPDIYYIHDLAISPASRGLGMAAEICTHVVSLAGSLCFESVALVAVGDATRFWQLQQFAPAYAPDMATKIIAYGPSALYMERILQA